MTRKSEYSCLPHAAAVAQMQARSVLRQVRVRAAPACPPEPPQKPVCRQFSRCEGCPYRGPLPPGSPALGPVLEQWDSKSSRISTEWRMLQR